ncbi:MAG: AAA family ATPase [Aggregatilineales bacterium]
MNDFNNPPNGSDNAGREIRLVAALTAWADENALFNAYGGQGPVRLMARASTLAQLEDQVKLHRANVVLIDHQIASGREGDAALVDVIQRLRHNPEYPIITFGVVYDPRWVQVFEDAGALGHISGPITPVQIQQLNDDLPVALQMAYQERLRPDYVHRFSDSALRLIDSGAWQRQDIAIWSPKGGVGKTFLAREIAVTLGVLADRRVLLIDADMNCGDQHTHLGLRTDRNVYSLATVFKANGNTLTPAMVQQHLTRYQGNLQVLVGVFDMTLGGADVLVGRQGEAFANALMDTLPAMGFDFIILDLGQKFFEPMHLVPLRRSTLNLVVVTAELSTALETELALNELRKQIKLDAQRFRLLINKWDDRLGLSAGELVKRTGLPEFARIPYDLTLGVQISLNQKKPLVLDKPNEISDAIINAVTGLYRPIETIWRKRGGQTQKGGIKLSLFGRK